MADVKSRVKKLEDGELTPAMADAVKTIVAGAEGGAGAAVDIGKEEIMKLVDEKTKEHSLEVEDRARRSKNMIIFGIPEPSGTENHDRKREDSDKAGQILNEIETEHKPVDIRRLGNYQAGTERPRPLRLSFLTQGARDDVIQAVRKAKKDANKKGETGGKLCLSVSVRKDLTPTERKEEDALFKELKEKQQQSQEAGDESAKWIRKNGKVVNVGRHPREAGNHNDGRG
jgi:hypothetical protein